MIFAQEVQYRFNASQNENEVYLSWSIERGSTCNGTDIERGFDSTTFEKIGTIYGVCGSIDVDQNFSFTDIHPISNSINYYRLVFGSRQYSTVLPIYFVSFNNFGYAVNNEVDQTTIYFLQNSLSDYRFILADVNGSILTELTSIADNKVSFDNKQLHHGFYIFMLTDDKGNRLQRGKIFIN